MPMTDNSEDQVNLVLWYQLDKWQGRIAYNYRSERFIGEAQNDGHPMAWWSSPTNYVDASVSYDINDNFTVYLQGQNITEEFESTYMQWKDVMVSQNVYEARYTLGVRAKF
jgi:outer membrane receptor protein involved in Fe transport